MSKAENTDTWPEIVKVLDKYSMEAWRAGVISERERIIKLLEAEFLAPDFPGDSITEADNCLINLGTAIALIKGETND